MSDLAATFVTKSYAKKRKPMANKPKPKTSSAQKPRGSAKPKPKTSGRKLPYTEDDLWGPMKKVPQSKGRPNKKAPSGIRKTATGQTLGAAKAVGRAYGSNYKPVGSSKNSPVEKELKRIGKRMIDSISGKTEQRRYDRSRRLMKGM